MKLLVEILTQCQKLAGLALLWLKFYDCGVHVVSLCGVSLGIIEHPGLVRNNIQWLSLC